MSYLSRPMIPKQNRALLDAPPLSIDTVTTYGSTGWGHLLASLSGSGAYPATNLAIYVPVRVRQAVIVRKLWVACTATGTDTVDLGVYNAAGTQVVSVTEAAKVISDELVIDVSPDVALSPGLYYMAMSCASNTATFLRYITTAPLLAGLGVRTEALGSVTLPATATWVIDNTLTFGPMMGMLLEGTAT